MYRGYNLSLLLSSFLWFALNASVLHYRCAVESQRSNERKLLCSLAFSFPTLLASSYTTMLTTFPLSTPCQKHIIPMHFINQDSILR